MELTPANMRVTDILSIIFNLVIIALIVFFHIQSHSSNCRGQVISKTKTSDGQTRLREANMRISEASPTEMRELI
jgi:large-conductance mechanosensitive channel